MIKIDLQVIRALEVDCCVRRSPTAIVFIRLQTLSGWPISGRRCADSTKFSGCWRISYSKVAFQQPKMRAPFQRLISAANRDNAVTKIVAASGGSLSVFDGASGSLLSRWTNHLQNDDGRPPKKRKTSNGESTVETSTSASAPGFESKARNGPLLGDSSQSFITSLIHTADGRNVVASTAEDKSIYVFELHQDGRLSQLSRRYEQNLA